VSPEPKLTLAEQPDLFKRADAFADSAIARLRFLLGPDMEIAHVGATAISDRLTKGDVDLVVHVEPAAFGDVRAILDKHFEKNLGSPREANFASYVDETGTFPLGIQLVVRGSRFDNFRKFTELLRQSESLRASYNALKQSFVGSDMEIYRTAKAKFIEQALAEAGQ